MIRLIGPKIILSVCLIAIFMFLLSGCVSTDIRPFGEKSITKLDLPQKNNFSGVTFLLKKPPRQEIVFLLSQSYTDAYIVVSAFDANTRTIIYDSDTSFTSNPESWLIAKKHMLDPYLVFHNNRLIAFDKVPDEIRSRSVVNLEWENRSDSDEKSLEDQVQEFYGFPYMLLSMLTIYDVSGLIGPIPPLPRRDCYVDGAILKMDSLNFSTRYTPSLNASHFLLSGALFGICSSPFTDVSLGNIINSPRLGSSVYADTILRCLADLQSFPSCPDDIKSNKQKCFDAMYALEGFNVFRYNPEIKTMCVISKPDEQTLYFWESVSHNEQCDPTIYENTFREIFIDGERAEIKKIIQPIQ